MTRTFQFDLKGLFVLTLGFAISAAPLGVMIREMAGAEIGRPVGPGEWANALVMPLAICGLVGFGTGSLVWNLMTKK